MRRYLIFRPSFPRENLLLSNWSAFRAATRRSEPDCSVMSFAREKIVWHRAVWRLVWLTQVQSCLPIYILRNGSTRVKSALSMYYFISSSEIAKWRTQYLGRLNKCWKVRAKQETWSYFGFVWLFEREDSFFATVASNQFSLKCWLSPWRIDYRVGESENFLLTPKACSKNPIDS